MIAKSMIAWPPVQSRRSKTWQMISIAASFSVLLPPLSPLWSLVCTGIKIYQKDSPMISNLVPVLLVHIWIFAVFWWVSVKNLCNMIYYKPHFVPRLKLSVVAKHIENRNLHYPVIFLSFPRSQRVKLHMSQMFVRAVGSAAFKSW